MAFTLVGRDRPLTPERRARTRKFLRINGAWSTISAVWFTLLSLVACGIAAFRGDWEYVAILAGCAAVIAVIGLFQHRWHRHEIERLDAAAEDS